MESGGRASKACSFKRGRGCLGVNGATRKLHRVKNRNQMRGPTNCGGRETRYLETGKGREKSKVNVMMAK